MTRASDLIADGGLDDCDLPSVSERLDALHRGAPEPEGFEELVANVRALEWGLDHARTAAGNERAIRHAAARYAQSWHDRMRDTGASDATRVEVAVAVLAEIARALRDGERLP